MLSGAPFRIRHTNNLLEGSFDVLATTYRPGMPLALEDDTPLLLGLTQVSRLLPRSSLDPNTMD